MDTEKLIQLAKDCGFSCAAPMDPQKLVFKPEVRLMCAADKCRHYNKSWACPPACGELDDITVAASKYKLGLIVQTIGTREDEFDFEAIMEAGRRHEANFNLFAEKLLELYPSLLPMGAGTCTRCEQCTYPDAPCRFPQYLHPSMEACGLVVSEVCTESGIPYYYGANSTAFVSCYLLE